MSFPHSYAQTEFSRMVANQISTDNALQSMAIQYPHVKDTIQKIRTQNAVLKSELINACKMFEDS